MKRLIVSVVLLGALAIHTPLAHGQAFFGRKGPAPMPAQQGRLTPVPAPAAQPSSQAILDGSVEMAAMATPSITIDAGSNPAMAGAPRPPAHMINSRSLVLDFEIKSVGPSGLGTVELWYTRNGQIWHKHTGPGQTQSPIAVEVLEDGLYGFTVVATNGVGLSRVPPQPGDPPQIWVEVDTTKPEVHLVNTAANMDENGRTLTLRWTASDKNMVARPITLSYSERPEGPWTPFATNLENTGVYTWQMSSGVPAQVLVKIEATDRVGNLGEDKFAMPAPVDLIRPRAAITRASRNGVIMQTGGNP